MTEREERERGREEDTALILAEKTQLARKVQDLEIAVETGIPPSVLEAIIKSPRNASNIVKAVTTLTLARNPAFFSVYADAQRREKGMWVGASLAVCGIGGSVVTLVLGAPVALAVTLLGVGTACAGATFAIITGKSVSTSDFAKLFRALRQR